MFGNLFAFGAKGQNNHTVTIFCISFSHHYADVGYALDSLYSWAMAYISIGFILLYWRQTASHAGKTGLGHYNVCVLYSI